MKVAIFARVSKVDGTQTTSRQTTELAELATKQGWQVVATVTEQISGAKSNIEREGLQELLSLAASGQVQKVLIAEVSRLGRKVAEVLKVIEALAAYKVSIYIANIGMETLLADGRENFMFKPILVTLAGFAEMERELLKERIKSGMEQAKKKGKKFGRPTGTSESKADLLNKYPAVTKNLAKGFSIRQTAKLAGCTPATVQKVKKALAA